MMVIFVLALRGARCARRGDFARHARSMRAAALLVGLFLVSYGGKVAVLGRGALATRGGSAVAMLRFHELCVFSMLLGGGLALTLGRRLRATRTVTGSAGGARGGPPRAAA